MKKFLSAIVLLSIPCFGIIDNTPPGGPSFMAPAFPPSRVSTNPPGGPALMNDTSAFQIKDLQDNLDAQKNHSAVLTSANKKLTERNEALEKHLRTANANIATYKSDIRSFESRIAALNKEVKSLQGHAQTSVNTPADAEQLTYLNAQIDGFKRQLQDAQNKVTTYAEKIQELNGEKAKLNSRLDTSHDSLAKSNSKVASLERDYNNLLSVNRSLENSLIIKESALQVLTAQKRALEYQSKDDRERALEERKDALKNDITNLASQLSTAQYTLAETRGDNAALEQKLHAKKAEFSRIQAQINDLKNSTEGKALTEIETLKKSLANRWTHEQVGFLSTAVAFIGAGVGYLATHHSH